MLAATIKEVWWNRLNAHAAMRTKCNFAQYRTISEQTSAPASQILIWTLYGSPLDVPETDGWPLTPQDEFFRDQVSKTKIRVVVFSSPYGSRRYAAFSAHINRKAPIGFRNRWFGDTDKLVARVREFEGSCRASGKLYFTSTDLIAKQIDHHLSKFSVAFVSDDSATTYCIGSSFAASRQGRGVDDIRDVVFFAVSDARYPGADGRPHYSTLFEQLRTGGKSTWFFEDAGEVAKNSSWFRYLCNQPLRFWAWTKHHYNGLRQEHSVLSLVPRVAGVLVLLFVAASVIFRAINWAGKDFDAVAKLCSKIGISTSQEPNNADKASQHRTHK